MTSRVGAVKRASSSTTWLLPGSYVRTRTAEIKKLRDAGRRIGLKDSTTLDVLCDRWLESKRGEVREVTRETYAHALKPVRRRLGTRRVQSLTYADVLRLRTWLSTEGNTSGGALGVHSVKASIAALKQVLAYGLLVERILTENVAAAVRAPRKHSADDSILERWTAEELSQFVDSADQTTLGAAWRLAALGLRREEVLGLSWDVVDFALGTIDIRQTRVAVSSSTDPRRWMLGQPKSAASRRVIRPDLTLPGTMSALRELKLAAVKDPALNPGRLVVVDELGEPVRPAVFSSRFSLVAAQAEVPAIKLHSTRHTIAYLMHDAGVPPVRAAAFLGHTLAVHLSVYLFAREDDIDLAGTALGASHKAPATA